MWQDDCQTTELKISKKEDVCKFCIGWGHKSILIPFFIPSIFIVVDFNNTPKQAKVYIRLKK